MDGMSPFKMIPPGGMTRIEVFTLITDVARKEDYANRKAKKTGCAGCEKDLSNEQQLACPACKSVIYWGKECQRSHWFNGHKEECVRPQKSPTE